VRGCSKKCLTITCQLIEGEGKTCYGLGRNYSGDDLNALIFPHADAVHRRNKSKGKKKEI
jgi:hypothetical protein